LSYCKRTKDGENYQNVKPQRLKDISLCKAPSEFQGMPRHNNYFALTSSALGMMISYEVSNNVVCCLDADDGKF
jgi:hypothetical protein